MLKGLTKTLATAKQLAVFAENDIVSCLRRAGSYRACLDTNARGDGADAHAPRLTAPPRPVQQRLSLPPSRPPCLYLP